MATEILTINGENLQMGGEDLVISIGEYSLTMVTGTYTLNGNVLNFTYQSQPKVHMRYRKVV